MLLAAPLNAVIETPMIEKEIALTLILVGVMSSKKEVRSKHQKTAICLY